MAIDLKHNCRCGVSVMAIDLKTRKQQLQTKKRIHIRQICSGSNPTTFCVAHIQTETIRKLQCSHFCVKEQEGWEISTDAPNNYRSPLQKYC